MYIFCLLITLIIILMIIYYLVAPFEYFTEDKSLNDHIDTVLYINLDHRTDRKNLLENELKNMGFDNITRIPAVLNTDNGHKGCCASHIKALEYAKSNNLKNVLILEDDFTFNVPKEKLTELLNKTINSLKNDYDIIMFSANICGKTPPLNENLSKVTCATTTSGYLINNHFYDTLLSNFRQAHQKLKPKLDHTKTDQNAIDQHWIPLQPISKWYIITPTIGKQRESFSDIMSGKVNYNL